MTVEELMQVLTELPPQTKVLISNGRASWSFLQPSQVNRVTALWTADAVMLGTPPEASVAGRATNHTFDDV